MEEFKYIPGLAQSYEDPGTTSVTQGQEVALGFSGLPYSRGQAFTANLKTTGGGDGTLLWSDPSGSSVRVVDGASGQFSVQVPRNITDNLRRGCYALSVTQKVPNPSGDPPFIEKSYTVNFNMSYDGNSPNPRFTLSDPDWFISPHIGDPLPSMTPQQGPLE